MSEYITRWCELHGDWDEDIDNPAEACPACLATGLFQTRAQLLERIKELEADVDALVLLLQRNAPAEIEYDETLIHWWRDTIWDEVEAGTLSPAQADRLLAILEQTP
jgi:hypothetical protein